MNQEDLKKLPQLNLPYAPMKMRLAGDAVQVFDPLRDKFVALTPEEYVRQQFTSYLINNLGYPPSLIANEIGLTFNDTKRRCDTVIFGRDKNAAVIVEYKAPDVTVTQNVFDQIVRYNTVLHAQYLVVSNGICHFCCRMDYERDTYHFIPTLPDYRALNFPSIDN